MITKVSKMTWSNDDNHTHYRIDLENFYDLNYDFFVG